MGRSLPKPLARSLTKTISDAFTVLGPEVDASEVNQWIVRDAQTLYSEWCFYTDRFDSRLKFINKRRPPSERSRKAAARLRRVFVREVGVPRDVHPRRLPLRDWAHLAAWLVGIPYLSATVVVSVWLGSPDVINGLIAGCVFSSATCTVLGIANMVAGTLPLALPGIPTILLIEWITYRDFLEDERRRNLGWRQHRRSALWYRGNVHVVDGKNFWEVRRRDASADVDRLPRT